MDARFSAWAGSLACHKSAACIALSQESNKQEGQGNTVEGFVSRYAQYVIGTLCGFDRLLFRGTLRLLAHRGGMISYLGSVKVLLKDFSARALALGDQLKEASLALARASERPIRYLASSAVSKEAIAREIARADGIKKGLICVITAVEPCLTYEIVRKRETKLIDLEP